MSRAKGSTDPSTVTISDLKEAVTPVTASLDIEEQDSAVRAEMEYTHLIGLQDHYTLKKYWAFAVMGLMFLMISFQCGLLGLVGAGVWSFKDYTWLLPALLVQNLAQIAGLAYIVVKALFNSTLPISSPHPAHGVS